MLCYLGNLYFQPSESRKNSVQTQSSNDVSITWKGEKINKIVNL